MNPEVLEVVTFTLKPGADEAKFLADNGAVERFCKAQPGFISRRLTRDADGGWIDVVEWTDMRAAEAAANAIGDAEGIGPCFAAIDMDTVVMRHLDIKVRHE
ncbi:antibiotic biosynthesis monooxygenase family protein [Pelagibacterium xiamenense]|uniref:antibiotic biosynthesis monooxygenase family protein n=1 Tax=Pelagibacterium xiamenense TaxID=2901140 RepID=UPI001E3074D5|nr:hypothetical protein [Pelagibacterium xiamenense]MCD7059937.1 hypothetical protein [Pelagibacterium xiamenense]